jgi:hypothetical protein
VTGRLHLSAAARGNPRIDLILNLTPSERLSGSARIQDRNMGLLLPALKAISQADFGGASLNVAFLNLARQRVRFHQEDVHDLDWQAMKKALEDAKPGQIDLKSLADRRERAQFFVGEVRRRIGGKQPPRVVIVLSSYVAFEPGENLQPIRLDATPDCRVYYLRFSEVMRNPYIVSDPALTPGPRRRSVPQTGYGIAMPVDELAPTLKPLAPRIMNIESPEQFRKALATILSEISSL